MTDNNSPDDSDDSRGGESNDGDAFNHDDYPTESGDEDDDWLSGNRDDAATDRSREFADGSGDTNSDDNFRTETGSDETVGDDPLRDDTFDDPSPEYSDEEFEHHDRSEPRDGFTEQVADGMPNKPSTSDAGGILATIAEELTSGLAKIVVSLIVAVTKVIPGTARFWRGLMNAGYRGLYATSGADVIGHIKVGNELKAVPLTYDYEKGRYENEYGDYWNVASEGDYEYRIAGKVPAVWASAASNELGSHVQAEVAEVIDQEGSQPLFDADVDVVIDATGAAGATGTGGAVADGGEYRYELDIDPGGWLDELVDLRHDGKARVVSMEKYYETYPSVVAPEEMQLQEERGRHAEQTRDYAKLALKMMLIAAAIIAVVELGPIIIRGLFGMGSGGGAGSLLPAFLGGLVA